MIKLTKTAKPQVLVDNEVAWTTALLMKIANDEKPTQTEASRYRHREVKTALVAETSGKCAYCESKLLHIHHGDVEHIYPKSLNPAKTFEWDNLTLACEMCNQNKSNKDPFLTHIVDPYALDPADHLGFFGTFVFPVGNTPHGKNTEVLLELNRAELTERRKESLDKVMGIFETILQPTLPVVTRKAIYQNLLKNEGSAAAQYSAMINTTIEMMKPRLPAEILE